MRRVRSLLALAMFSVLFVASANPAWAQKRGRADNVQLTGYQSFDGVFRQVRQLDNRIVSAESLLQGSRVDLNKALGLRRNTPIQTALADLKKRGGQNLQVVMKGKVPQLTLKDAAPKNVRDASLAVNRLSDGIAGSIQQLIGIPDEAKGLVKRTSAFPDRFKQEINHDLFGMIFKAPKTLKRIHSNVKVAAALPDRSVQVVKQMNQIVQTVTSEFTPGRASSGNNRGTSDTRSRGGGSSGGGSDQKTRTRTR